MTDYSGRTIPSKRLTKPRKVVFVTDPQPVTPSVNRPITIVASGPDLVPDMGPGSASTLINGSQVTTYVYPGGGYVDFGLGYA